MSAHTEIWLIVWIVAGAWIIGGSVVLYDIVKETIRIERLQDKEDEEWASTQHRTDSTEPGES